MSEGCDSTQISDIINIYLAILVVADFADCRSPDGGGPVATGFNCRRDSRTELSAVLSDSEQALQPSKAAARVGTPQGTEHGTGRPSSGDAGYLDATSGGRYAGSAPVVPRPE